MEKKKLSKSNQKTIKNYLDLFYMTPQLIEAKNIARFLESIQSSNVELWEAVNVLEITLSNGNDVAFEPIDVDFKDPSDASFVKNRGIQTIFAVSILESDLDEVTSYFHKIIEEFEGFLCTDSSDFQPIYVGRAEKIR